MPPKKKPARAVARSEALEKLFAELDKEVAPGAGRPIREQPTTPCNRLSCGLPSVDLIMGGGMPEGRVLEFYGTEAGGKTSLSLCAIGAVQRAGFEAAYIDVEHSFDTDWAEKLGVDIDRMLYHSPDHGEQALQVVERMVRSGEVRLVVVDSVSALVPLAELKGEIAEEHVGRQARLMSQGLRRLVPSIARSHAIVIFINQLREKIGVSYGNPETTSGGRALKFYSSIRLDVRKGEPLSSGGERIGDTVKIRVVKNKTFPPYKQAMQHLLYVRGFDAAWSLFEQALTVGVVEARGSHYGFPAATDDGMKHLGQGKEAAVQTLRDSTALQAAIMAEVLKAL